MPLFREIEGRLKAKCDTLTDAFLVDDIGQSCRHTLSFSPFANIALLLLAVYICNLGFGVK